VVHELTQGDASAVVAFAIASVAAVVDDVAARAVR
jgi:hypothetical protein